MKKWIVLSVLTLGLLGGSWYLYLRQPGEETLQVAIPQSDQPLVSIPLDPSMLATREVTLFVGSASGGAVTRMIGTIEEPEDIVQAITETVQLLIQPDAETRNTVMPEGTELLNVFLTNDGVVYLNMNRHLQDRHIGGLSAELATITSLVNTLLFNFKEIHQIQILVEGAEIETLAGHVDCRKPFSKMLLLQNS